MSYQRQEELATDPIIKYYILLSLVTHGIQINLHLTGKSRLILKYLRKDSTISAALMGGN